MPVGTALSQGSAGESLSHFNAIRMRVTGVGSLQMELRSFDGVETQTLVPFTLLERTNREPTRLCNFVQQRASLEVKTDKLNEHFRINRIILFSKELWSQYSSVHD